MKNWQDPNAAIEAANYNNPIPSRVLILQTLIEHGGATQHELAVIFDLNDIVSTEPLAIASKPWFETVSLAVMPMVAIRIFTAL